MDFPAPRCSWGRVSECLLQRGFALFNSGILAGESEDIQKAQAKFIASCFDLPPDNYSEAHGRNRRYGRFVLDPQSCAMNLIPPIWDQGRREFVTRYHQQGCFNPEHNGELREFASLTIYRAAIRSLVLLLLDVFWPHRDRPTV